MRLRSSPFIPANTRHLGLDLLRMTGIMLVVWSQSTAIPPLIVGIVSDRLGPTGVDLLFVLGGFLIGSLLFDTLTKNGGLNVTRV